MSFRSRLTLFFVLIVIVPMVSVAFVLFRLIADNENGKGDARVAARQGAVINLYGELRHSADRAAVRVGKDVKLAGALRSGDAAVAQKRAKELLGEVRARRIVVTRPVEGGAGAFVDVGHTDAVFPFTRKLTDQTGRADFGSLQVSIQGAGRFVRLASGLMRAPGVDARAIVVSGGKIIASTLPGVPPRALPPAQGRVTVGGETYKASSFPAAGFSGEKTQVSVLVSEASASSDVRRSRILAAGILIGFFILAFTFAVLVSRSLQRQIEGFLDAARRLGGGDFSAQVPTAGRDEFAALGGEFNKMSAQLEARLEELREERGRLQRSMQRIGETFASNLDRTALLEIVVRTAVEGVGADGGRAAAWTPENGTLELIARTGALSGLEPVLGEVEQVVLQAGISEDRDEGEIHTMAHPLRAAADGGRPGAGRVQGVVSVGRVGRPFSESERDLFHYLAAQASVSIENVGLHETVERQAVTDELTGLSNRRRFEEAMASEVERARRFGQELGLVMLDIDDFKLVNDTHGHQQGDLVLREVARVLRESAREIDEPARYGGEELAIVLPGTDLDGAASLAERVRAGIEALEIAPVSDGGAPVKVTASFGVATLPGSAADVRGLIEAADDALYEAKRAGKNKVIRAG